MVTETDPSCWCKGIDAGSEWAKVCEALAARRDEAIALAAARTEELVDLNERKLAAGEEAAYQHRKSERLRAALMEVVRIIDHEQPLGNGHRIREVAWGALIA